MRLLLDECADQRLRHFFVGHECQTAAYAGFAGVKNGVSLEAAEAAGFDVIITDQEISFQRNLSARRIAILVLCAPTTPTNRLADLKGLIPAATVALEGITAGGVVRIE